MRWAVILYLGAVVALFTQLASADTVYSWTDEIGVKRYSNSHPPQNARQVESMQELPFEASGSDERRRAYDRMVEESAKEAERQFEEHAREEARRAAARKQKTHRQEAERVAEEQARLLEQIEEIRNRGYSASFTKGMQDNLIREVQEKLDQLKSGAVKP